MEKDLDVNAFIIKYFNVWALQQKSKEELIEIVQNLQDRDQKLTDLLMKSNIRVRNREDKLNYLRTKLIETETQRETFKRIADLKLGNTYNVNATWIDKIVFVLKAAGRPLRSSEIISVLLNNDHMFRSLTDHQKGLSAHLTKALKYGRIVGEKRKGENGYLFYLPKNAR